MIARGEIGFPICSLASRPGPFSAYLSGEPSAQDGSNSIFLVVTWANMLCTIIGPLIVGVLVRRQKALMKRAEAGASAEGAKRDVLGSWAVK